MGQCSPSNHRSPLLESRHTCCGRLHACIGTVQAPGLLTPPISGAPGLSCDQCLAACPFPPLRAHPQAHAGTYCCCCDIGPMAACACTLAWGCGLHAVHGKLLLIFLQPVNRHTLIKCPNSATASEARADNFRTAVVSSVTGCGFWSVHDGLLCHFVCAGQVNLLILHEAFSPSTPRLLREAAALLSHQTSVAMPVQQAEHVTPIISVLECAVPVNLLFLRETFSPSTPQPQARIRTCDGAGAPLASLNPCILHGQLWCVIPCVLPR